MVLDSVIVKHKMTRINLRITGERRDNLDEFIEYYKLHNNREFDINSDLIWQIIGDMKVYIKEREKQQLKFLKLKEEWGFK